MKYLFSDGGLRILESLCFTRTLFAFDFDGTLAPIVARPSDARVSRRTSEILRVLNAKAPIAIISGRSLQDLKSRMNIRPAFLIGNHGQEGLGSNSIALEAARVTCRSWQSQVESFVSRSRDPVGVEVEDKEFSLAVHYRRARRKRETRLAILDFLSRMTPSPRLIFGKSVVNLIPAGAPHKGMALLEAMGNAQARSAFYIGDDDTDEDVFALPDDRVISVRVGKKRSSHAKFYLRRQGEVNLLLSRLVEFFGEAGKVSGKALAL
ncbi:MAG: trehalose-phosphatase [Deltaproteobacteria bacterium]|nr:trehalose-phosphatase [Deltaproteobacteria bacterium]